MKVSLTIVLLGVAYALLTGCELPQDKAPEDGDALAAGDGPTIVQEWRYLTILDRTPMTAADGMPGADIDAIVIHRDGSFVMAGCTEVSLYGEDDINHGENPHLNPDKATLAVREQVETGGFISLAGGTLLCELPLPVLSGDEITIWEVAADGLDSFEVALSTDPSGGTSANAGSFISTQTFVAP